MPLSTQLAILIVMERAKPEKKVIFRQKKNIFGYSTVVFSNSIFSLFISCDFFKKFTFTKEIIFLPRQLRWMTHYSFVAWHSFHVFFVNILIKFFIKLSNKIFFYMFSNFSFQNFLKFFIFFRIGKSEFIFDNIFDIFLKKLKNYNKSLIF